MKRFPNSPVSVLVFLFFPYLFLFFKSRRKYAIIYISAIFLFITGCYLKYYDTNTRNTIDQQTLNTLKTENKYFIAHLKTGLTALKNIGIDNNILSADVDSLTNEHSNFVGQERSTTYRYSSEHAAILNEVHIYAPTQSVDNKGHLSVPLTAVSRVDIYKKNKGKTNTSTILSTIGFAALAALIVGIIVAASQSSPTPTNTEPMSCDCPRLYTYSEQQYHFKSGVFSGAIYSSLERSDYLPLENLVDIKGKYLFRLVNNRQEEHFINQVQLIRVPHDITTAILIDRHGIVHNYTDPLSPVSTSMIDDKEGQSLKYRDGNAYIFNEKADPASDLGSVILTFNKPATVNQAKLIVHAKNSMWAGLLYEQFSTLFGEKFQEFTADRDKADRNELEQWEKDQGVPLMVYLETDAGWKLIDYFPLTGNTASRDMIMPVNIADVKGNTIRIKIESAYMFWKLDYSAMDFSQDRNYKAEYIHVAAAVNNNDTKSKVAELTANDRFYDKVLQHNYISFEFDKPRPSNYPAESYFLLSSGYYHSLKQYYGKPDWWTLMKFKRKGAFSEYSEEKYKEAEKLFVDDKPIITAQVK